MYEHSGGNPLTHSRDSNGEWGVGGNVGSEFSLNNLSEVLVQQLDHMLGQHACQR